MLLAGCHRIKDCPSGYGCNKTIHKCRATPGKVPLKSINLRTREGCTNCTVEGVTVHLLGEKNANYTDGIPCDTRILDHTGENDFGGGFKSLASFNGTYADGSLNPEEKNMMDSCYEVSHKINFMVYTLLIKIITRRPSMLNW